MNGKSIPGPTGLPWLGVGLDFARDPLAFLVNLAHEYGDIVRFHAFGYPFVLVSEPGLIREVLVEKADLFPKAQRDLDILAPYLGHGLLTNSGESHRQRRKLVQPAFHMRRIQGYAEVMVEYTERMLAAWQGGETLDVSEEMMGLTAAIVAKTLFDLDVAKVPHLVETVGGAVADLQEIANHDYTSPGLLPHWVPTRINRKRKSTRATLDAAVHTIISERRATAIDGQIMDRGDLLSMILLAQDEAGTRLDDEAVRDEVVTLFVAGHETTSNALTWTWLLLAQNPSVEARLHAEVDRVLGGRAPTLADLPNLPYTLMVLKESMRLYPPAWVLNSRQASEATTLGGYPIARDTQVYISPHVIHHLPRYYPEPERFNPERFTPEAEANLPRYAYMPFGGGPRICIGNSFAMMEAHLLLAAIARRFTLELAPDQTVEPNPQITLSPKNGLRVRLVERGVGIALPANEKVASAA